MKKRCSKDIIKLIQKGESQTTEFKTSLSEWKEAIRTLSAFSWTKGGLIIFGVSRSEKIVGLDLGRSTIENLANDIKQNTDPKLYPSIKSYKINGKNIVLVETENISDEPTLAFGRPYKRLGKSTHQMSGDEYKRLIWEMYEQEFDSQVCKEATLKDIDWNFVKKEFIPQYERVSGKEVSGKAKDFLKHLGCIKNNKPTNAGIVLFGKDVLKFFMNAYVALARYRGDVEDFDRLDYKEFNGNLFQQIDKCDEYVRDHMAIMSRLPPNRVRREDIPEYSRFCIRELITNAVCHRNYRTRGSKVIVKMFKNRIDFYNPGGLAKGITPKNILTKQYSRNPTIAKVFSKVEYVEEVGEGWNKIIDKHKEHPLKPKLPKIEADRETILISMFSTKEKFEEMVSEEPFLNERQKKAVEYVKKHGRLTNRDLQRLCPSVTRETLRKDLNDMIDKKIIVKLGSKRGVYYKLV